MRIPREDRPVPYFNRRDQYRMLAMVGLLCLVMVAIKLAARPQAWHWLLPSDASEQTDKPGKTVSLKELNFHVKEDAHPPLPPGVFRAVAVEPDKSDDVPTAEQSAVTVPAAMLSGVEDNTLGVRRAEIDAYLTMLDKARRLPQAELEAHTNDDVAFTVIMLQPDDYRGKLVSVTGHLRRLTEFPVMPNDRGIDRLYEGWLLTEDSGNNPWRFVCSRIPQGVPLGEQIEPVKVRVVGYFFKRMGYASEGGQHVAPTLLAGSFEVLPVPVNLAPQMQAELHNWMLGFIGAVIVGLAVLIWWFARSDRKYARSRMHQLATSRRDADASDLDALQALDTHDPSTLIVDEPDV